MKDGDVDTYIAMFETLGHCMGMDLDDPAALWIFRRGLPTGLTDSCIDIDASNDFEAWKTATRKHHRNFLRKKALRQDYGTQPSQTNSPQSQNKASQFYWNKGPSSTSTIQPAHPRLPPRDPNAMDTSAVIRKASTEEEKARYRAEGCCFHCTKQGHLA
jgi:hypothetical protein